MDEELINGNVDKEKSDALKKILNEFAENIKKNELLKITSNIEPVCDEINKLIEDFEKESKKLKAENFKNKIAIIAFNGALIALMVSSAEKVKYSYLSFILLFFSISFGILHLIVYYLRNEYYYIEGDVSATKYKELLNFCKEHKDNSMIVHDTESFIRGSLFNFKRQKPKFDNVHELIAYYDKHNNVTRQFLLISLYELSFYIPFIWGLGLVVYSIFIYLK